MAATAKIIKFQVERNPDKNYAISADTIYINPTTSIKDYLDNFTTTAVDEFMWDATTTLREFLVNLDNQVSSNTNKLNNLTAADITYNGQSLEEFLNSIDTSPGNFDTSQIMHHETVLETYLDTLDTSKVKYDETTTLQEFLTSITDPSYTLPADYILKNTLMNVSPYSDLTKYYYNIFNSNLQYVIERVTTDKNRFTLYVYNDYESTTAKLLNTYTFYNDQTRKETIEYVSESDMRIRTKTVEWFNEIVLPSTLPPAPTNYNSEVYGTIPSKRRYHVMSSVYNFVFIHGGDDGIVFHKLNDLYRYDAYTSSFEKMESSPVGRYQHTAVVYNNMIYVFGGFGAASGNQPNVSNQIWKYHPFDDEWYQITPASDLPPARMAHAAVIKDNYMYIYGGFDGANYLDDFWRYNFETNTWENLNTSAGKRTEHVMFVYNDEIYIAGGAYHDGTNHYFYTDIQKFNGSEWELITDGNPRPTTASSVTIHNDKLYILGGYDLSNTYSNFIVYDFSENTFTEVDTPLPALSDHASTRVGNELFIFGGYDVSGIFYQQFWVYNFERDEWTQLIS